MGPCRGLGRFVYFTFALKENYLRLRTEAYVLIGFGVLYATIAILPYFPAPALLTLQGVIALGSIGILLFATRRRLAHNSRQAIFVLPAWEVALTRQLRQVESLWLGVSVAALAWVHLHQWSVVALIPLQIMLLWKSARQRCELSEILAFIITFGIGASALFAALQNHSFSLRDLPTFAQVSVLVLFLELWAMCEYYRRIKCSGTLAKFAESMRLFAYLVAPLIFIPSIAKHYPEHLSLACWLSASIAYLLARKVKHHLIRSESIILSFVATIFTVLYVLFASPPFATSNMLAIFAAAAYFSYFLSFVRRGHPTLLEKKTASVALGFFAAILFVLSMQLSHFYWAGLFFSVFYYALFALRQTHPSLVRNITLIQGLIYLAMPVSWAALLFAREIHFLAASIWIAFNLSLLFVALRQKSQWVRFSINMLADKAHSYLAHHLLVSANMLFLLATWDLSLLLTPWLILQGSYLFWTQKHSSSMSKFALSYVFCGLLKLAFIDAANALLWQKVALMLGIGVFMVIAAFAYQKRNNQLENSNSDIGKRVEG